MIEKNLRRFKTVSQLLIVQQKPDPEKKLRKTFQVKLQKLYNTGEI